MNLADMLSYADIHELGRIARTYECECDGHSKNQLIQSILSTVSRKEVFEQQVLGLTLEDVRFLNSLLFDQRDSFSLEELVARVQQTKFIKEESNPWNPRDMITSFKHKGWLFNGFSQQTKYLFQVPHDLKKRFSDVLTKEFQKKLAYAGEPEVYRDEQTLIADDILQFLKYLHKQEAAITAEGFLYKRSLGQILELMTVKEEQPPKNTWRFGYGRRFKEYPNRFSFIYDYCYFQELIEETPTSLILTEKGRTMAVQGAKENIADIYRFWLRLYKNPIPNLQGIVNWVEKLSKNWVSADSMGEVLCPLIRPFYYDTSESILEQRVLQMMMHLGLIKIGEESKNGTVLQITRLGRELVQGTYVRHEDKVNFQPISS